MKYLCIYSHVTLTTPSIKSLVRLSVDKPRPPNTYVLQQPKISNLKIQKKKKVSELGKWNMWEREGEILFIKGMNNIM